MFVNYPIVDVSLRRNDKNNAIPSEVDLGEEVVALDTIEGIDGEEVV